MKTYTVTAMCTRMDTDSDDVRRIEELRMLLASDTPIVSDLTGTEDLDIVGIVVTIDRKVGVIVPARGGVEVLEVMWEGNADRIQLLEKKGSLAKAVSMQYLEGVTYLRYWMEETHATLSKYEGPAVLGSKIINSVTMAKENIEDFATGLKRFIRNRVAAF